jgi:hypothetical protein
MNLEPKSDRIDQFLSYLKTQKIKLWIEGDNLKYHAPKGTINNQLFSQIKQHRREIIRFLQQQKVCFSDRETNLITFPDWTQPYDLLYQAYILDSQKIEDIYSKPDFLIIGAQKSATTLLHNILAQHPEIVPAYQKELHYFDDAYIRYGNHNLYHQLFPPKINLAGKKTFEATPDYLYHPKCSERIAKYNPDLKLIVMLREPVARAYSAWNMFNRLLAEYRSFEEAIHSELEQIKKQDISEQYDKYAYLKKVIYVEQLKRYTQYFPLNSSLLVLEYSDFFKNPYKSIKKLYNFLEINNNFKPKISEIHKGDYNPIDCDIKTKLKHFLTLIIMNYLNF